ncbi:MAG: YHS domain-containing protein, partial [Anaerolineae bacterium]
KGHTYHFCRPTCKERFLADPETYIAPLEEGREEGQDPDRL